MSNWTPLEDCYDHYHRFIDEANTEGLLETPEQALRNGYPPELHLSDEEKEELGRFVYERSVEFLHLVEARGFAPRAYAQTLLNGLISAMLWERERIG